MDSAIRVRLGLFLDQEWHEATVASVVSNSLGPHEL